MALLALLAWTHVQSSLPSATEHCSSLTAMGQEGNPRKEKREWGEEAGGFSHLSCLSLVRSMLQLQEPAQTPLSVLGCSTALPCWNTVPLPRQLKASSLTAAFCVAGFPWQRQL